MKPFFSDDSFNLFHFDLLLQFITIGPDLTVLGNIQADDSSSVSLTLKTHGHVDYFTDYPGHTEGESPDYCYRQELYSQLHPGYR